MGNIDQCLVVFIIIYNSNYVQKSRTEPSQQIFRFLSYLITMEISGHMDSVSGSDMPKPHKGSLVRMYDIHDTCYWRIWNFPRCKHSSTTLVVSTMTVESISLCCKIILIQCFRIAVYWACQCHHDLQYIHHQKCKIHIMEEMHYMYEYINTPVEMYMCHFKC